MSFSFAPATSSRGIPAPLEKAVLLLAAFNVAMIAAMYFGHSWLYDADGRLIDTDYINVWAAGKLALEGHPALAWDWAIHKQLQVGLLGRDYVGDYAWHYPPPFLFVAMLLAHLPYAAGLAGWAATSFLPYAAMMRGLVGQRFGLVVGTAFPVVLANTMAGQNGFLTAALLGGTLVLMPARPVLAGICLGLLSYKPQYGLLFPLALVAARQWRTFAAAAITTATLVLISWIAFGIESWQAFFHWMPTFSQAFFSEGRVSFYKLQSLFGLVRMLGGSEHLAWAFQWVASAGICAGVVWLWRGRAAYELKAASLATGALLLTPYLFLYDMMVLAIPVGLLVRIGLESGFRRNELAWLAGAMALLIAFPFTELPLGLASTLIVAALVVRRIVTPAEQRLIPQEIAALR
ncbi:MAG TPA: glycosyltransferase family 87 protein [Bradyrhizobium sp.]|uniref:glycosyltransferase family 87 protein n=1 Tax=Bradyrhizobium sp. TaxID=376 RepID=UPI002D7E57D3|nr:glycosyltransferase family 87 protein [Bradyrhizobium sp.]HET7885796.1 glycosyltransferase family 87 protein [Bradyrhizobium sp.]